MLLSTVLLTQKNTVVNCTDSAEQYRCQTYWQCRFIPLSTVLTAQNPTVVNCTAGADAYRCQLYCQRRIVPLSTVLPMRIFTNNSTVLPVEIYTGNCTTSGFLPLSTGLTVQNHIVVNWTASDESYRKQYFHHAGNCTAIGYSYRQLYFQCRFLPLSTRLTVQNHIVVNCTASVNLTENSTSSGDSYRQLYCHWRFIPATVLPVKIHTSICAASEEALRMSLLSLHSVHFNCWASM